MANVFDQFDGQSQGNVFDQFDMPAKVASEDVPGQINIPGIGKPSLIGMAKGLWNTAKSAATLPGDVYAGRVDPTSEEGIRRATDMAAVAQMGAVPTVARRAATPALKSAEIQAKAEASYNTLRDQARAIPLGESHSQALADHVRAVVNERGPRAKMAPQTHIEINDIAKARDVGDLIDSRKALAKIVREGEGEDIAAAKMAINNLDAAIERVAHKSISILRTADKNYAIAKKAADVETKLEDARRQASTFGSGGNEGNKIRQTFRPMLEKGRDERLSDNVRQAVERTVQPGAAVNALRPLAIFDPTQKVGLGLGAASLGSSIPLMPAGYAARAMYDRILRKRAEGISEAMRAEAPANVVQPGYRPGGIVGMPQLPGPGPLLGLAPMLNYTPEGYPFYQ